jgi:hypothetical protein
MQVMMTELSLLLGFVLLTPLTAAAGSAGGAGALAGSVSDPSGLPIPKATVTVSNPKF